MKDNKAKVNLFKTKKGYAIPVVYGDGNMVTVFLNDPLFTKGNFTYRVYQPGIINPVNIPFKRNGTAIEINVPLIRGAAMVAVSK